MQIFLLQLNASGANATHEVIILTRQRTFETSQRDKANVLSLEMKFVLGIS